MDTSDSLKVFNGFSGLLAEYQDVEHIDLFRGLQAALIVRDIPFEIVATNQEDVK